MSTSPEYVTCIQRLLTEIGYRYEPFPPYDADYWGPFHVWILNTLGPTSSWTMKQLAELEHAAGGVIERSYPHASAQLKFLFAKLTAIAILIDDSIEDEVVHEQIMQFSQRLYRGEAQQNGMLALYHATIQELSEMYGNDSVLRGLAIVPWINYIDACLMEKQILSAELFNVQPDRSAHVESLAPKFPYYLRSKSGIAEAYAAGIFKAAKEQTLPLTRYIKTIPDLTFYIEVMNDLLSFHKEEIDGETYNFIHLRTRSIAASGARGSGDSGEWTCHDTVSLVCDELQTAAHRIDGLLRLEECERKMRGDTGVTDIDEVDIDIAKQWRGWRDGYISWHLECRRYKLGFLKRVLIGEAT
ncbi:Terpenoid synthase [Mycena venus]|uniref:Terpenoid synthase n=1 Tax=Mycena venus TaxID=2733690 RepID=A0A8H7DDJ8_9AGAR|nr:Terpenoid synthase [Mycena venus]